MEAHDYSPRIQKAEAGVRDHHEFKSRLSYRPYLIDRQTDRPTRHIDRWLEPQTNLGHRAVCFLYPQHDLGQTQTQGRSKEKKVPSSPRQHMADT